MICALLGRNFSFLFYIVAGVPRGLLGFTGWLWQLRLYCASLTTL
jgi:hypothetical protein